MCEAITERFFILKSKELRRLKFLTGQSKILFGFYNYKVQQNPQNSISLSLKVK